MYTPKMTHTVQMTARHGQHYSVTRADGFTVLECMRKLGRFGSTGAGYAPTGRIMHTVSAVLELEGRASHGWADFETIK